mgnify:CR=1 FL=1
MQGGIRHYNLSNRMLLPVKVQIYCAALAVVLALQVAAAAAAAAAASPLRHNIH